nr:CvpA family protein [uncultured Bacillus sp.]
MLDLTVVIVLGFGFLVGLKRGFIRQLVHLTGFIISSAAAFLYHDRLAPKLIPWIPYPASSDHSAFSSLFNHASLEDTYYRAIAFVVIFFAVNILLHLIGHMLNVLAKIPVLKQLNVWAGGILGFIELYLIMFILLFIAVLLPFEAIQTSLAGSIMAELILKKTPFLSQQILDLL